MSREPPWTPLLDVPNLVSRVRSGWHVLACVFFARRGSHCVERFVEFPLGLVLTFQECLEAVDFRHRQGFAPHCHGPHLLLKCFSFLERALYDFVVCRFGIRNFLAFLVIQFIWSFQDSFDCMSIPRYFIVVSSLWMLSFWWYLHSFGLGKSMT